MAFCPGCGSQIADNAASCPSCGKSMGQASTGGGAAAAPAPAANSGLADNIAGLLCYSPIGLIADIIFLVTDPYKSNKFLRFHAFQSLFLCGAMIALAIAFAIVNVVVGMIFAPIVIVLGIIELLIWLGSIILWVLMMIKAYQMSWFKLPVIGAMAEKQANAA